MRTNIFFTAKCSASATSQCAPTGSGTKLNTRWMCSFDASSAAFSGRFSTAIIFSNNFLYMLPCAMIKECPKSVPKIPRLCSVGTLYSEYSNIIYKCIHVLLYPCASSQYLIECELGFSESALPVQSLWSSMREFTFFSLREYPQYFMQFSSFRKYSSLYERRNTELPLYVCADTRRQWWSTWKGCACLTPSNDQCSPRRCMRKTHLWLKFYTRDWDVIDSLKKERSPQR